MILEPESINQLCEVSHVSMDLIDGHLDNLEESLPFYVNRKGEMKTVKDIISNKVTIKQIKRLINLIRTERNRQHKILEGK